MFVRKVGQITHDQMPNVSKNSEAFTESSTTSVCAGPGAKPLGGVTSLAMMSVTVRRPLAAVGTLVGALLLALAPVASAAPAPPVQTPDTSQCPFKSVPGPAVDTSEKPAPGKTLPSPLPVPDPALGGKRMAECGDVLPPGAAPIPQDITAHSWLIADLDSGAIIAAKDPHGRHRPASTMKVLTALTALRELKLDDTIVGSPEDAAQECTCVGIEPGQKYSVAQMVAATLLNSGNDAAHALAMKLGGEPATLGKMNKLATALGAKDTRAETPSGLDSAGMSTSAYDLGLIFRAAMHNADFARIDAEHAIQWPASKTGGPEHLVINQDLLLGHYPGALGGKNGYTNDARQTFIGAADHNGRRLVVVLMQAEKHPLDTWEQAARLLDYGYAMPPAGPPVGQLVNEGTSPSGAQSVITQTTEPGADGSAPGNGEAAALAASRMSAFGTYGMPLTVVAGLAVVLAAAMWARRKARRRATS